MAERIQVLIDDPALREQMGQQGRNWTLDMFTWDRVADRVLACYDQALAK